MFKKFTTKKKIIVLGLLALSIVFTSLLIFLKPFIIEITTQARHIKSIENNLKYNIDHEKLLSECRELIKNRKLYAQYNDCSSSENICISRIIENNTIPELIKELKPIELWIEKDKVLLIFSGGHIHLGVYGYAKDTGEGYGDKLIPGLYLLRR